MSWPPPSTSSTTTDDRPARHQDHRACSSRSLPTPQLSAAMRMPPVDEAALLPAQCVPRLPRCISGVPAAVFRLVTEGGRWPRRLPRTPAPQWRSRDRTTPHRRRSPTRGMSSTRTPMTPNRLRSPILPIRRSSTPRRWSEMALHVGYQGATGCLPDAQPGARALMAWWLARFGGRGAINSGILNCQPVVGGTARSLHSEGRAADLGVRPITRPTGTRQPACCTPTRVSWASSASSGHGGSGRARSRMRGSGSTRARIRIWTTCTWS